MSLNKLVCHRCVSNRYIDRDVIVCTVLRINLDGVIEILLVPLMRRVSGLVRLNLYSSEALQELPVSSSSHRSGLPMRNLYHLVMGVL